MKQQQYPDIWFPFFPLVGILCVCIALQLFTVKGPCIILVWLAFAYLICPTLTFPRIPFPLVFVCTLPFPFTLQRALIPRLLPYYGYCTLFLPHTFPLTCTPHTPYTFLAVYLPTPTVGWIVWDPHRFLALLPSPAQAVDTARPHCPSLCLPWLVGCCWLCIWFLDPRFLFLFGFVFCPSPTSPLPTPTPLAFGFVTPYPLIYPWDIYPTPPCLCLTPSCLVHLPLALVVTLYLPLTFDLCWFILLWLL